jgi:hypothetical protein
MMLWQLFLVLIAGSSIASPLQFRGDDPQVAAIIANASIAQYVPPSIDRVITDWLAVGDSFSAGVSADVPSDELNWWCSRFMSYPNQMNENPRFPGHSTSRTFVFGSCTGATQEDVRSKQLVLGDPDLKANYPKIGKPQIGTLSVGGNDLGFGDVSLYLAGGTQSF